MRRRHGAAAAAGIERKAGDRRTASAGNVRNVVLVGHSGSGKTTLVEALLGHTGTIQRPGRIEDGTTVSDFDEVEIRQQRSVNLTLAPFDARRRHGEPARHAGLRRLHRRPAGRAAGGGLGAVRRLRRPTAWTASRRCCGTSAQRSACRAPSSSPRSTTSARDFDGGPGGVPRGVRRRGAAAVPAGAAGVGDRRDRADRAAVAEALRLLVGHAGRGSPESGRGPAAHGRAARRAHRGHHHRERGRVPHGPVPRRRGRSTSTCSSPTWRRRSPGAASTRCCAVASPLRASAWPSCSRS